MDKLKCNRCKECNGKGCIGQLPGLGGAFENENFILNCAGWEQVRKSLTLEQQNNLKNLKIEPSFLMCAPVTGAQENIGYENEQDFYEPYLHGSYDAGIGLCVGDGTPDCKLLYGVNAVQNLNKKTGVKAAIILKPYPLEILKERIKWAEPYASYFGIDIDAYNILTMRNKVSLVKQNASTLSEYRKLFSQPLIVKGIFTDDDIELVKNLRPDIVYISNHGGRIETVRGSTADFLQKKAQVLKHYCKAIWVDGGIRCKEDIQTAKYLGADKVLIARPLIRACFDNKKDGIKTYISEII